MLNNVFTHGGRGGGAGVLYGLSDFDHTGAERQVKPVVLYGSPEVVMQVIDASRWAQRYTSGVLSFKETQLPAKVKRQIIAEHLAVTFPGLDPSRVAAVYIEHRDKNILELHYWIANTNLVTGKRLEPYWHCADCSRFRRWVRSVNARFNLEDPECWRALKIDQQNGVLLTEN